MISVVSVFLIGIGMVMFDAYPAYRDRLLNKIGGVLVLIALVIGATGDFVPAGLTSLLLGFTLFAVGIFYKPRRLHR